MGTTLTGTTPQDTYDSLIKVTDNGPLSATAKRLSDGLGNDSTLYLSTTSVGIGVASPVETLEVGGTTIVKSGSGTTVLAVADTSTGGKQYSLISAGTGNVHSVPTGSFYIRNSSDGVTAMTLTPAGNVGIGTSSPATILEVSQATPVVRLQASAADSFHGIEFRQGAGLDVQLKQLPQTGEFRISSGRSAAWGGFTSFYTDTVERVRITNNGLTFNGDTAAANALDDYEEGTWTPTLTGSGSNPSYTATALGNYTKIGRQVTAQIDISISTYGAGSGSIRISLPFTVNGSMGYFQAACYVYGVDINGLYLTAEPNAGNSFATINQIQDDAAASGLPQSAIAAGDIIRTTVTYFV